MILSEALAESKRRGWRNPNLFMMNSGAYVVSGRDAAGLLHTGSSKLGWSEAFEDADERDACDRAELTTNVPDTE